MKKREKLIEDNTQAINDFIGWYGENRTAEIMISFLFEMQSCYTIHEANHESQDTQDCVNNFRMLHELIKKLKPVDE